MRPMLYACTVCALVCVYCCVLGLVCAYHHLAMVATQFVPPSTPSWQVDTAPMDIEVVQGGHGACIANQIMHATTMPNMTIS